jgi:multidrug resistance protein
MTVYKRGELFSLTRIPKRFNQTVLFIPLDFLPPTPVEVGSSYDLNLPDMSANEPELARSYTADAEGCGQVSQTLDLTICKQPTLDKAPQYEVFWGPGDSENPRLWPLRYKGLSVVTMSLGATVVSLFSTLYTSGIPGLEEEFHISKIIGLLGVFTYLLGMAFGTIISAPLSEVVGRRPVYLASMAIFLLLILPSALAHNIEVILIARFFGGLFGSAIMGNSPASVNDIVSDKHRAMAFGIWSIGPANGPVYGPILGGFIFEYLGWRWTNWVVLIFGSVVFGLMCCIKETYAPVILRQRAAKLRKETGDPRWWTRYDGEISLSKRLNTGLRRPFVMLSTEPIW